MAKIAQLEPQIFVASQLGEADFAPIAASGFRAVVANRPDGEAPDQLPHDKAREAARRHGLEFRYQPVMNFDVTEDEAVDAFRQAMLELPGPILFYCRTGTRSTLLWAQASVERLGIDETIELAARAGCDRDAVRDVLDERAGPSASAPAARHGSAFRQNSLLRDMAAESVPSSR